MSKNLEQPKKETLNDLHGPSAIDIAQNLWEDLFWQQVDKTVLPDPANAKLAAQDYQQTIRSMEHMNPAHVLDILGDLTLLDNATQTHFLDKVTSDLHNPRSR